MSLVVGTWDPAWGHTWVTRGFGKVYALRSLAGGSALCVADESILSGEGPVICRPGAEGWQSFPTPGEHSCHILLLDRQAVVADYTSGSLSLFPLDEGGLPSGDPDVLYFEGSGPVKGRQDGPHIHSSWLSPEGDTVVVADLGSDALYRFAVRDGRLETRYIERRGMPPGSGPRHCAFGAGVLYVATELSDEVLVLSWPGMDLLQRVIVNPQHPGGGGHLALSPDGRFLYVSSRLQGDGIAVLGIGEGGFLTPCSFAYTRAHPRHFCLSPDGSKVAVACRDGNAIQLFDRCAADGSLSDSGKSFIVVKPVYVETV